MFVYIKTTYVCVCMYVHTETQEGTEEEKAGQEEKRGISEKKKR